MTTKKNNRKDAIQFIKNYIQFNRSSRQLYSVMSDCEFAQYSHSEWAAKECLRYIRAHPELDVLDAVEAFSQKMLRYCLKKDVPEVTWPFSVAHDTAENIYDQLYWHYKLNEWKGKSNE